MPVPDFSEITPRIFTGAAITSAADVDALVSAGVTHVVDARSELDDAPLLGTRTAYLWNPTNDDGQHKPVDYWAKTLTFALPMFSQPRTKIYLHCAAGVNRGPSNALCVMLAVGWDFDAAVALMHAKRPVVNIAYRDDALAAVKALGYA
jgi:dual specificity phosphatase 3